MAAVDAGVPPDVFLAGPRHCVQSRDRLCTAYDAGAIFVCDIVHAELTPGIP